MVIVAWLTYQASLGVRIFGGYYFLVLSSPSLQPPVLLCLRDRPTMMTTTRKQNNPLVVRPVRGENWGSSRTRTNGGRSLLLLLLLLLFLSETGESDVRKGCGRTSRERTVAQEKEGIRTCTLRHTYMCDDALVPMNSDTRKADIMHTIVQRVQQFLRYEASELTKEKTTINSTALRSELHSRACIEEALQLR